MARYTGQTCPVCDKQFVSGDDVVVCPECGTPHHRECWFKNGKCANTDRHGELNWYEENKGSTSEKEEPKQEKLGFICPRCGHNNPVEAPFCENCQLPRGAQPSDYSQGYKTSPMSGDAEKQGKQTPMGPAFHTTSNPYGHLKVDGVEAGDLATFVGSNARRYVPRFIAGKKAGWNWGAFFLGPFWYMYRKITNIGLLYFAIVFVMVVSSYPMMESLSKNTTAYMKAVEREQAITAQAVSGVPSVLHIQNNVAEIGASQEKDVAEAETKKDDATTGTSETVSETQATEAASGVQGNTQEQPNAPPVEEDLRSSEEILNTIAASKEYKVVMAIFGLLLVLMILFALFADYFYRSHCIKHVKNIKNNEMHGTTLFGMEMHGMSVEEVYMRSRGGVSWSLPALSLLIFQLLTSLFISL